METTTRDRSNHQYAHKEKTDLGNDLNKVKESISNTASHISDKATDIFKNAQEKTADIQEHVVKYVKENPIKSLGYSLLAGFIAALLLRK